MVKRILCGESVRDVLNVKPVKEEEEPEVVDTPEQEIQTETEAADIRCHIGAGF